MRVIDSSGAPVGNASVSLVRGLHQQLARGMTNQGGTLCFCEAFTFAPDYQVVVQKDGFETASQFAKLELVDSMKVNVMLLPNHPARAQSDAPSNRHIDADAIARGDRNVTNAFDVIRALRPEMLPVPGNADECGAIQRVVIDGRHFPSATAAPPSPTQAVVSPWVPGALSAVSIQVRSTLNSIKPEHIAAMEYRSCRDTSSARMGRDNALVISLKKGVQFEEELGSYIDAEPARRVAVAPPPTEEPNVTNVRGARSVTLIERLEPYRFRIMGLFDGDTGEPIEGAEVRELATGTKALTSPTGTVSLAFMKDGGGPVVLAKTGYKPDIVTVAISPRDTVWLTFLLFKAP
ncbi:MAG: carboxypeptidase regulatory-like domain-containing protein [bacterium]